MYLNNSTIPIDYGLDEDLVESSYNMTSIESALVTKVAGFGTVSGVIIALIINMLYNFKYETVKKKVKIKFDNEILLKKLAILLILGLSLPFVLLFLTIACIYKLLCLIIIKRTDRHFAGFLDSFDVFWSLEDDASKSVISVLGIIESTSSQDLVDHIREKLQQIEQIIEAEKLFYRRTEEYGFYYWRKCCYVDISQYVRIVDVTNSTKLTISDLEEVLTEISYQPLPFNDEGLFQILVTNQTLSTSVDDKDEYAVIFRIHHSVGDGVALIEFLCETLADDKDSEDNVFRMPESFKQNPKNTPADLVEMITKLFKMPCCLVDGILREPDKTSLHGPTLNGKKIFKWATSDDDLFRLIKEIKDNCENTNFTDILATGLSCGLKDYFLKDIDPPPNAVAVILPIRFPEKKNDKLKLQSNFTVSILDLPIGADIEDVQKRFKMLRDSADPLTNYYFLKLCSVLSKEILYPVFNSNQATMVFSNMPGPKVVSICGGVLKSLVFFVPNKGNTGIGITALCYDGVLRFGAMADSALVASSDELAIILDGMFKQIKRLHNL